MNLLDDLDILFADSGVTAVIDGGEPVPVIFWVPGKAISMFDGSISSTDPGFMVKTAATGSADNGSSVVISGAPYGDGSYTISDRQPDGAGLSVITLTKA